MYASTWICTKEVDLVKESNGKASAGLRKASLAELNLDAPAMRFE
jgi:betaine lipid synthase